MVTYGGDFENLKNYFVEFLPVPFTARVLCIDDPGVKSIIAQLSRPVLTYGFSKRPIIALPNFSRKPARLSFR